MLNDNHLHWKRNLFLMWYSQILVWAGFAAVMPFIPLFMKEKLGLTEAGPLGMWISAFHFFGTLGYALFCPIWGALSDRFGVKPMLLRGTFGTAFIFPLMAWSGTPLILTVLRFASAAMAGTTAAAQILLVKNTPENKQGFALGVLSTAIWGGSMLGNVVGGIIVHYYGYAFTFIACGVMYFLAGIAVLPAREDFTPSPRLVKKQSRRLAMPQFTQAVWMLLALMMLTGLVRYVEVPYLAMLVEAVTGPEKAAYWTGIISGFVAVGALLSGMITGYLADKVRPLYILIPAFLISVLTLLLQTYAENLVILGAARTIMYLAAGGTFSVLQKLLSAATPRRKRGKVFGFASTANSAGVMLSTIVAGGAMWVDGVRGVFLAAALLTLLLMPGYYLVLKIIMHQRYFASQYKKILGK